MACRNKDELESFQQESEFIQSEIQWVYHHLSSAEKNKVDEAEKAEQLDILLQPATPTSSNKFNVDCSRENQHNNHQPVDYSFDNDECIKDLAEMLNDCQSAEAVKLLQKTNGFTPERLNQAAKLLSSEKHAQINNWVLSIKGIKR